MRFVKLHKWGIKTRQNKRSIYASYQVSSYFVSPKETIWNPADQSRRIQSTRDSKTAELPAGYAEQS